MISQINVALALLVDEESNYSLKEKIIKKYQEPWRFYHNLKHINQLLDKLETKHIQWGLSDRDVQKFRLAILFHDVIYYPWSTTNEEDSADFFLKCYKEYKDSFYTPTPLTNLEVAEIADAIRSSKWGSDLQTKAKWVKFLVEIDTDILNSDHATLIDYDYQIFKENQFLSYHIYGKNRFEFLMDASGKYNMPLVTDLYSRLKATRYKVGIYCGTFEPFHAGHYNVLKQAEKIFDKVIIAIGHNPSKPQPTEEEILDRMEFIFKSAPGREVIYYPGLITEMVNKRTENVTLVRGLRNATDFPSEDVLHTFVQELKDDKQKDLNIVYIKCDKQFEHISSSQLKPLLKSSREKFVREKYLTYKDDIVVTDLLKEYWKKSLTEYQ